MPSTAAEKKETDCKDLPQTNRPPVKYAVRFHGDGDNYDDLEGYKPPVNVVNKQE